MGVCSPGQATTDAYNEVKQKEAGAARVLQPLNHRPTITEHPDAITLDPTREEMGVEFDNVSFTYALLAFFLVSPT